MPLPSVFQGVQDCRLPALKPPKPSRRPPRQQLLQLHAPAIDFIFQGVQDCRLPGLKPSKRFRRLPRQQLLQLHTCPCHLFFRGFKPALTPSKRSRRPPTQPLLQLHAPAICFSGGSRQVCLASNPPNASAGLCLLGLKPSKLSACLQGNNSYSYMPLPSAFHGVQACLRKATTLTATSFARPQTFTLSAGLQGNNSYSYMPLTTSVSYMPQPSTCSCCLPGLKPSKLSAGLQGNNSCSYMPLPSAFQGVQACPTATCPCHLFFRRFKTAVCPASNPPNPQNASAGLCLLCALLPPPLKRGRRHQGISPFYNLYYYNLLFLK